jgi:predicted short-subunit dehydrogenase-like oxidoreductase (DUF2520 family)
MTSRRIKRHRKPRTELAIAIVGPGRVGQAMGKLLRSAGFPVRFVAARRIAAARHATKFIGGGRAVSLDSSELEGASIFLLTTSDAVLAPIAARLAGVLSGWKGKVALHTCGSLPASVLTPLRKEGAAVGSLHPFQTIPNPTEGLRNLRNCFWGIEGDPAARRVATRWVKALEGVAFAVPPEKKILYHAAAFLVCPTEITLLERSTLLLRQCGIREKIARPMLAQIVAETVSNFAKLGARRALTGPAVRGDWPVIRGHLRALECSAPDVLPVYKSLLRAMLRLAGRRPPRDLQRMLDEKMG